MIVVDRDVDAFGKGRLGTGSPGDPCKGNRTFQLRTRYSSRRHTARRTPRRTPSGPSTLRHGAYPESRFDPTEVSFAPDRHPRYLSVLFNRREIEMAKKDCTACKGSGQCNSCDGKGNHGREMFGMGLEKTCKRCNPPGSGNCRRCNGSGVVGADYLLLVLQRNPPFVSRRPAMIAPSR